MAATGDLSQPANASHPLGGKPMWDVAYLFPPEGDWTERDYLNLENLCGDHIRVELYDGRLEVLPVPTETHQFIILYLLSRLQEFTAKHAPGVVLFSGIRVRLPVPGPKAEYREPDIVYMKAENAHRRHDKYWDGADLVMEVVSGSPEDRERDLVTKRREYALAGIPEYWIVDPETRTILVLKLAGTAYEVHGEFAPGAEASSRLLAGFTVSVNAILAAGGK